MAQALSRGQRRLVLWLCVAAAGMLLARPWWDAADQAMLLARDGACAAALLPGLALAVAAWLGRRPVRLLAACALLVPVAAVPLIAMPAFAALRRLPPDVLDEVRVAGAGWLAVIMGVVLPRAAPGLAYGAALALAPPGAWRVVAAAAAVIV